MKCPVCKDCTLAIADRQGIEIDYCPDCRGVWLDRGELDKLIERAAPEPQPRQRQSGGDFNYQKPQYQKHRKKSILKELFDF